MTSAAQVPAREQPMIDCPLLTMTQTSPTDYWNDSCAIAELEYAVARGASGATSNPPIVLEVLRHDPAPWRARARELYDAFPTWSERELTWQLVEELAVQAAAVLAPLFEASGGAKGRLSLQSDPTLYRDSAAMGAQARHFAGLAPNIQVKLPVTAAGLVAIEEATAAGVHINATVNFTLAGALAVAEAVERGLARWAAAGHDPAALHPVCTLMVGRLDDWLKAYAEREGLVPTPGVLDWAGVAVFKRAYALYQARGYRTRLLAAAYRHRLHWTELIGGDLILTMPHAWQVRFNASGITPQARIAEPVPAPVLAELSTLAEFRKAYEPEGLAIAELDRYGATLRTLRQFIGAYHDLQAMIRDFVLPNPDLRPA
jgi:transaldolase